MASYLRSVLFVLVGAFMCVVGRPAVADGFVPTRSEMLWECEGHPSLAKGKKTGASPQEACAAAMAGEVSWAESGGIATTTYTFSSCGAIADTAPATQYAMCYATVQYTWKRASDNASNSYAKPTTSSQAKGTRLTGCPPNAVQNQLGSCTCGTGFSPDATGKTCDKDCEKGKVVSEGYYDIGPNSAATPQIVACSGNCRAYFNGDSPAGSAVVGGVKHWFAKGYYSQGGEKCSASQQQAQPVGTGTAAKPQDSCAANQGFIKMNGKTVCVDQNSGNDKPVEDSKDKSSSKTEKTSQTNPDGSTTVTETTTKTDSNGNKETTVTKTTTGTDGKVTTESETSGAVKPGTTEGTDDGTDEEPKGECEKNPSKAGCGGEAASVGTLYTPKDKTFSGVLTAHRNTFMSSAIGSAVGGFFVVSSGGSCPTWNAQIPFIKADVKIDQFCSTWAIAALAILKTAILVAASFFAFRVAVE